MQREIAQLKKCNLRAGCPKQFYNCASHVSNNIGKFSNFVTVYGPTPSQDSLNKILDEIFFPLSLLSLTNFHL
jgi:hypothetical protein